MPKREPSPTFLPAENSFYQFTPPRPPNNKGMRHPKMVLPGTAIPRPPRPDYQRYRDNPETYLHETPPNPRGPNWDVTLPACAYLDGAIPDGIYLTRKYQTRLL